MPKKIEKIQEEKVKAIKKNKIEPIIMNLGREDLNDLVKKINEIIDLINEQ